MSKPTFLTIRESLAFRNGEHLAKDWKAYLNGEPVTAVEADTERGYVDVIDNELGIFPCRVTRLFGTVRLKHVEYEEKPLPLAEHNALCSLWAGTREL